MDEKLVTEEAIFDNRKVAQMGEAIFKVFSKFEASEGEAHYCLNRVSEFLEQRTGIIPVFTIVED